MANKAKKITMDKCSGKAFYEVWTQFINAKKALGVSDTTLRNYRQYLHNISKHFDIEMPFDELTKSNFEEMIVSMRDAGLAHNSIATYVRTITALANGAIIAQDKIKCNRIREQ